MTHAQNHENTTMKHTLTAGSLLTSMILVACGTTQHPPPALVEARSTVQSAALDATVQAQAPLELKKATDSLNRANALLDKGEPLVDVSSAAYIANQQAKTAMAIARAKSNDAAVGAAELERERARADIRTTEAQRARSQTGAAQQQAALGGQAPADLLGRFGKGVAAVRGIEVPQPMLLDIDEPDDRPLGIPQHAFAQLARRLEDFAYVGCYLHPASTQ